MTSLKKANEENNICSLRLHELDQEAFDHLNRKDLASKQSIELRDALTNISEKVQSIEKQLLISSEEESKASNDVALLLKSHSVLKANLNGVRTRISECSVLLSNIVDISSYIDKMKHNISELSRKHSALLEEVALWNSRNDTLKVS